MPGGAIPAVTQADSFEKRPGVQGKHAAEALMINGQQAIMERLLVLLLRLLVREN